MATITIDIPNTIPLNHTHEEAVMQSTRVVNAMTKWFGAVDVSVGVSVEKDADTQQDVTVVSFSFEGERSKDAAKNVGFFMENGDLKSAFIKPSQAQRLVGSAAVKMNLDTLSQLSSNSFDMAAYDAGHNGSIISRSISAAEGRSKG